MATASIALTSDPWSGLFGSRSSVTVRAYFITQRFKMKWIAINFQRLKYPRDTNAYFELSIERIDAYEICSKIISITAVNASVGTISLLNSQISPGSNFGFQHMVT